MPKIDITKIIYVCDSCNKHFTDSSGSVLTFESSNKKITLCDECTRDLSKSLKCFMNKWNFMAECDDICEIVHGSWKSFPDCGVTRCTACDWSIEEAWWSNYCPNCGAKMDVAKEHN